MTSKLPSQKLNEKLEKIETSETPKKRGKLTIEMFRKLAKAAKSTFKDEDLHPSFSF